MTFSKCKNKECGYPSLTATWCYDCHSKHYNNPMPNQKSETEKWEKDNFIDEIIGEFEEKFCNNHQKPIRFLRSVFYDEQDGAEEIEDFIRIALAQSRQQFAEEIIEKLQNIDWTISQTGIAIGTKKAVINEAVEILKN